MDQRQKKKIEVARKSKGGFHGLFVMATLCFFSAQYAQEKERNLFRHGGLIFGDFYHIPNHHLGEGNGATGAVLRRGYLTFDADFGQRWFSRVRIEVNQSGEFETYRFKAGFKDLYAGPNAGSQKIMFGLSPTPTFDLIESHWKYLSPLIFLLIRM